MVEKAIIVSTAWYDDEVEGDDVIARIEVPDKTVSLACMNNFDKRVIISFDEIEALYQLMLEARQEWGDPVVDEEDSTDANNP